MIQGPLHPARSSTELEASSRRRTAGAVLSPPRPQGAAAEQQHWRRNTTSCTVSMTPAWGGMHHAAAGTADVSCHRRWRCAARFGSFRGRFRVGTDEVGRPIPQGPCREVQLLDCEVPSSGCRRRASYLSGVPQGETHGATNFRAACIFFSPSALGNRWP